MDHNTIEMAKDAAWVGGISVPLWIINPTWIPPVILWGGLIVVTIRVALAIRDWRRRK